MIEVDGSQHNDDALKQRDDDRTAWLRCGGFHVLRFRNDEVTRNIDPVLDLISQTAR